MAEKDSVTHFPGCKCIIQAGLAEVIGMFFLVKVHNLFLKDAERLTRLSQKLQALHCKIITIF